MSIPAFLRRNIIHPLWIYKNRDKRLKYLKQYEKLQYLKIDELRRYQKKNLKKTLINAYQKAKYYRTLFDKLKFNPEKFDDFSQLQILPVLTKEIIQNETDQIVAEDYDKGSLLKYKTGGSTGKALTIYSNRERLERGIAAGHLVLRWAGWNIGEPVARVWGNPPIPTGIKEKMKKLLIEPVIWLDTIDLNASSMLKFVEEWEKANPILLHGHAHSLFMFAKFLKSEGILHLRPKGIISTSMMLLSSERIVIEEIFGVKVFDLYGCEEVGLIGCECEKHEGMHLNSFNNYVEFVKDDGTLARSGEQGKIVITSFTNHAMPLIRYKIEDIGIPSNHQCACGRGLPMMEKIAGRMADFLIKKDGTLVAGISLIERTLTKIIGISQMQIIQEDIDQFHLNIVKNKDFSQESQTALFDELKFVFNPQIKINIKFVPAIQQEKSGKYRFSICKLYN